MKIIHICPNSWGSNCYLLCCGGEAYAVDPSPSADIIIKKLNDEGLRLRGIILTHGHFDHVLSAETLHIRTGAPVMIHRADNEMLPDPEKNAFGTVFGRNRAFREADILLDDGTVLELPDGGQGCKTVEVIHTPGHTKGSICLKTERFIVTGDTLFSNGFGRIDFYGGSLSEMKQSLKRLNTLDHALIIHPGHGESTTLAFALSHIRFLNR